MTEEREPEIRHGMVVVVRGGGGSDRRAKRNEMAKGTRQEKKIPLHGPVWGTDIVSTHMRGQPAVVHVL